MTPPPRPRREPSAGADGHGEVPAANVSGLIGGPVGKIAGGVGRNSVCSRTALMTERQSGKRASQVDESWGAWVEARGRSGNFAVAASARARSDGLKDAGVALDEAAAMVEQLPIEVQDFLQTHIDSLVTLDALPWELAEVSRGLSIAPSIARRALEDLQLRDLVTEIGPGGSRSSSPKGSLGCSNRSKPATSLVVSAPAARSESARATSRGHPEPEHREEEQERPHGHEPAQLRPGEGAGDAGAGVRRQRAFGSPSWSRSRPAE